MFGGGEAWPPHSTLPNICFSPCVCLSYFCLPCKSACPSTLLCVSGSFCSCQCVQWVLLDASVAYPLIYTSVYVCHSGQVHGVSARLSSCMYQCVHVGTCIYEHTCLWSVCMCRSGCPYLFVSRHVRLWEHMTGCVCAGQCAQMHTSLCVSAGSRVHALEHACWRTST